MTLNNKDPDLDKLKNLLDEIASYHGHYCPGIAYGLRVAIFGLNKANVGTDCDLNIFAKTSTCPLDAIQIVTGCTIENGKLHLNDHDQRCHEYAFWNKTQNKGVCIELKKLNYQDSPEEITAINLFEKGDKSQETLNTINSRLNRKIKEILISKEDNILKYKPLQFSPISSKH